MKPRFVLGAQQIQFSKGIRYPVNKPAERLQAVSRSAGGSTRTEDLGITIRSRILRFKNLPVADWLALCDWYDNIVYGAGLEFTYYDEIGESMLVIMRSNPADFSETSYQRYAGELELEVVG